MPIKLDLRKPINCQGVQITPMPMPLPPPKNAELKEKYTGGKIVAATINGKTLDEILDKVDLKKKKTAPKNNIKFIF